VGETLRFMAMVLDQEGEACRFATVAWTSSDPYEVYYDSECRRRELATMLNSGWGLVTAASIGVTSTASINVMRAPARVGGHACVLDTRHGSTRSRFHREMARAKHR